jgi:hypothetical protein
LTLKIVLCLPEKLGKKLKKEIPRGQRSEFIIELLKNHFNENDNIEKDDTKLNVKRLVRVKDIPILYPAFSQASIRNLIHLNTNQFNNCLKRLNSGKKIVIDLDLFEKWVDSQL